jgi:ribosomal protein S18 acetylase RimI-like enzyme
MSNGGPRFAIRPYCPADSLQLPSLYESLGTPYRVEDDAEVAAMRTRALWAQQTGDRWSAPIADEPSVQEAAHLAFWVAVATTGASDEVVGTVGLRRVGDASTSASDTAENSLLPLVRSWIECGNVGEVRKLRVAHEWRRCGLATALMQELVNSSISSFGLRSLVLNTTAAQIAALALYTELGFHELGRSYFGSYELVWMQRQLDSTCL